jgi:diaminopimelate epimerase
LQDFKKRTVHSVEGITPEMCGNAFRAFEYWMNIMRATKGAQVEVFKICVPFLEHSIYTKQEGVGRNNRPLSFNTTRTA